MEHAFAFAAANGQHAVRGNGLHRLPVFIVHLELLLLVNGVGHLGAHHHALIEHHLSQSFAQVGVLADHLGNDVPSAFQRLIHVGHTFFRVHKATGEGLERFGGGLLCP